MHSLHRNTSIHAQIVAIRPKDELTSLHLALL